MRSLYLNINMQLLENALKITGLNNQDEVINLALAQLLQTTRPKETITQIEEKTLDLTSLDEWTKSLIGLIPSDDSLEGNVKQDHLDYLEKKYQ